MDLETEAELESKESKAPFKRFLSPLKMLLFPFKILADPFKNLLDALFALFAKLGNLSSPLEKLSSPLKRIGPAFKGVITALERLPIPKKLRIPAVAGAVLLTVGGAAFGLSHVKHKAVLAHHGKPTGSARVAAASAPDKTPKVASASAGSAPGKSAKGASPLSESAPVKSSTTASAAVVSADAAPGPVASSAASSTTGAASVGCSGIVRDIYRQTVAEDQSVTLAEVRSEVQSSGVSCAPVPAIAAQLKELSPGCRDMVQYTYLGVRDGNPDITVNDVRQRVVEKSVACDHDRSRGVATVAQQKTK